MTHSHGLYITYHAIIRYGQRIDGRPWGDKERINPATRTYYVHAIKRRLDKSVAVSLEGVQSLARHGRLVRKDAIDVRIVFDEEAAFVIKDRSVVTVIALSHNEIEMLLQLRDPLLEPPRMNIFQIAASDLNEQADTVIAVARWIAKDAALHAGFVTLIADDDLCVPEALQRYIDPAKWDSRVFPTHAQTEIERYIQFPASRHGHMYIVVRPPQFHDVLERLAKMDGTEPPPESAINGLHVAYEYPKPGKKRAYDLEIISTDPISHPDP